MKEVVGETASDLSEKASALADEAVEAAKAKAETAKDGLSGMLEAFGGALRAASDHLAKEQPAASKMVSEAATGLEGLSSSIGSKPLGSVLEDMRSLGRDNAGGLFAGSVLAGLALGRFFRASEPGGDVGPNRTDSPAPARRTPERRRATMAADASRPIPKSGQAPAAAGVTGPASRPSATKNPPRSAAPERERCYERGSPGP